MTKINSLYQETVRIQEIVCGLLFSIFSFIYLFVFQRDILEAFHFSLAHGKTHFSPFGSAFVMTLTLLLLRWAINRLVGLKNQFISLTYLPSFFVLMAISDIGRDVYTQNTHTFWLWMLPILVVTFIGSLIIYKRKLHTLTPVSSGSKLSSINTNLVFMLLCCIATPIVGNTDTQFHYELQVERCLRERNLDEAMRVGGKSMEASRTLTSLRAFTLSQNGMLGEKLFTYPQYYGVDGLFFADDSLAVLRYTNDSLFDYLGASPRTAEGKLQFLHDICYKDEGRYTALDYYLSALLLDKRLESFATAISDFYDKEDSLPCHYREALLLYQKKNPQAVMMQQDSCLIQKFSDYQDRKQDLVLDAGNDNLMRREYGETYWWYYDYQ